jgi:hypothetical protein
MCRYRRNVGDDSLVTIHGDRGGGIGNICDGAHIASSVDKTVALLSLGQQVDHCYRVICESPFSRGGYRASNGTGDCELVFNTTAGSTAYNPSNQGRRNQKDANSCYFYGCQLRTG